MLQSLSKQIPKEMFDSNEERIKPIHAVHFQTNPASPIRVDMRFDDKVNHIQTNPASPQRIDMRFDDNVNHIQTNPASPQRIDMRFDDNVNHSTGPP